VTEDGNVGGQNGVAIKTLEIRDAGTFIGVLAIRPWSDDPVQRFYFHRHGYQSEWPAIIVTRLSDSKSANDPYDWPGLTGNTRTMREAHLYIDQHFNELRDGDVVDVEFILGETETKKVSERLSQQ